MTFPDMRASSGTDGVKLLGPPYGWPNGTAISMRWQRGQVDGERLKEVCLGFGCPPSIADKIVAISKTADRYDCRLQHVGRWLKEMLAEIGVDILVHESDKA